MKISIKILSVLLALVLLLTALPFSGSAKTLAEIEAEIEEYEKEIANSNKGQANAKQKLAQYKEQSKALDEKIAVLEKEIAPVRQKVNELSKQIKEYEASIRKLESEISSLNSQVEEQNRQIDETYDLLKDRVRADYMAGETSELELFLNAGSFEEFLVRSELLRQVAKRDNAIVDELESQISSLNQMIEDLTRKSEEIETKKSALEKDKSEYDAQMVIFNKQMSELETAQAKIQSNIKKQNELIATYSEDSSYYKELLAQAEKDYANVSNQIDKEIANGGSSGSGYIDNGNVNHSFRVSSKGLISPLQEKTTYYSQGFAAHSSRGSAAVDLCAPANRVINGKTYYTTKGAKLYACATGTVIKSSFDSISGHCIVVDHGNGLSTLSCHLDARYVGVGDKVVQGQVIGIAGNSGYCIPAPTASNPVAGSHLHFEVRLNGSRVNPEYYLPSPLV